ncbi:GIY-YIG nuclease family protein, partial [Patescibacteria group bacterium]|nr:GIY-YIG nuclease family protein [Patescibacteria group bacterium]
QQMLDALPESPGVYIFYGDTDIPLYIGKSVNIKNRVLSHFSAASLSSTELKIASQVKRVETVTTEGELGALLRESKLIKQMQPVYNRRLRGATKLVYLGYKLNDAGYKEAVTFTSPPQEVLGIFKSLKQAKETLMELSEKHNLCKKLLNLEKPTSSCFGYQLEKCKGACVGKETPVMHNLRFDMAFVQTKLKSWPFDGAVMISEGNSKFLVDNWQYCELQEDNVDLVMEVGTGDVFDLDTYKILSSYIYSAKKQKNIVVLKK